MREKLECATEAPWSSPLRLDSRVAEVSFTLSYLIRGEPGWFLQSHEGFLT